MLSFKKTDNMQKILKEKITLATKEVKPVESIDSVKIAPVEKKNNLYTLIDSVC